MKNIALALGLSILLSACSSGTTIADLPSNVTNRYTGTYVNTPGSQRGTVTLDIVDDNAGGVTGNIIFESNGASCLRNGPISEGTNSGFNVAFEIAQQVQQFTITTTVTDVTTTETTTEGVTDIEEIETEAVSESVRTASSGIIGTEETNTETARSTPTIIPPVLDQNGMVITPEMSVVTVVTRVTRDVTSSDDLTGIINVQLTSSNEGAQLNGTYTSTSDSTICSNQSGSGTMSLSR